MNKKQIKLLGLLGCFALIGSASAAWVFNQDSAAAKSISLKIQGYASVGTVSITDDGEAAYLDLDDGKVALKNANDIKATYTADATSSSLDLEYKWDITLSTNLAKYIQVSPANGTWTSGNNVFGTLPVFSYIEGKNPTNLAEYNEMCSLLNSDNEYVTLKCTASVKKSS